MADINPLGGALVADAAYWRARMDGDPTDEDWLAFAAWLEARPENRHAFDELDFVLGDLEDHKAALAARLRETAPASNIIPLRRMTAPRAIAWGAGLAAAAALLFVLLPGHAPRTTTYAWATKMGERQDVPLEDGSVIHLNTDTAVTASFTARSRTVRMDKGEALFDVSVDPKRPFTVIAGDQQVEVIGTAFNVLRYDGSVTVTVSRGVVRASITPQDAAKGAAQSPVKLTVGDQYSRREGAAEYHLGKVDPSATLAWREGRLFYDNAEFSKVVSDLNRNFPLQIAVTDDAVRKLRFSGVLKIDDEISVLHRLESFLPITMQTEDNRIVLKARSGE